MGAVHIRILDKFFVDVFHVDLFELRTVIDELRCVTRFTVTVVARIPTRERDVLPGFGAESFGGGVEHEEPPVEFEECQDSVGGGDGQREGPREPIEGFDFVAGGLDGKEGGNREGPNRHRQTEDVEECGVDTTAVSVFGHEEAVSGFDRALLDVGEVGEFVDQFVNIVGVSHSFYLLYERTKLDGPWCPWYP